MNRQFAYSGAIPLDTDLLSTNIDAYIGLSKLAIAILGTSTLINHAICSPTSPASLNISVSPCEIYALEAIDSVAYGDLGTNASIILKQGINLSSTTLAITAPSTGGYSQNYLIEFAFDEVDGGSEVLAYYNASNPASPWSGPNNTGAANNTVRQDTVSIQAKAGVAAPTGTQTTPTADSGYIGCFVVTVANGQTTITSGNISTVSGAPLITETLTQKISQTTADGRYSQITQIQTGQFEYAADSSLVANTVAATLSPAITSYVAGMIVRVLVANTNTGASTLNINGVGATAIQLNGLALAANDIVADRIHLFSYDGTVFELINPASVIKNINPVLITSTGTYTPSAGLIYADVEITGGGGGGGGGAGGTSSVSASSGGGAGGYCKKRLSASTIGASQTVTIGAGGAGGTAGNHNGSAGGTTTFGSILTATGGSGGVGGAAITSGAAVTQGAGGGAASGGDINIPGGAGGSGMAAVIGGSASGLSGFGGQNQLSSQISPTGGGTGNAGNNYGGGGGGTGSTTSSSYAGGAGAAGVCMITEYLSI